MAERIVRLEAFVQRLLEEKAHELAKRDAQITALEQQRATLEERRRDITDANEVLRTQLAATHDAEAVLRTRAEQHAARAAELEKALRDAQTHCDTLEVRDLHSISIPSRRTISYSHFFEDTPRCPHTTHMNDHI